MRVTMKVLNSYKICLSKKTGILCGFYKFLNVLFEIAQQVKLVINAQSEAAFFDGVQFTVEIEGEIAQEDVEIIWMTIGGNTEYVEGNDRIIAEIKISDNDELICDTKINFAKKAIDAIEDVLERNGM